MFGWSTVPIGAVATLIERAEIPTPGMLYRQIGVRWWGEGAYERETIDGGETQYAVMNRLEADDIVINKIWARHGSVSVVQPELAGCYCSTEFPIFRPNFAQLEPRWFYWMTKTKWFWDLCDAKSRGTSGKNRIRPDQFLQIEIPLPPLAEQRRIVATIERLAGKIEEARRLRERVESMQTQLHLRQTSWMFERIRCAGEQVPISSTFVFRNELIRPNDGSTGRIRFVGLQHIESHTGRKLGEDYMQAEELPGRKFRFYPGDIVYGYLRPYLNKVWIADTDGYCSVDQYVLLPLPDIIDTEYLARYLRSESFLVQAVNLTHNLMLPRLRSGLMGSISIPLTSLDEQRRVVADLDRMQTKIGIIQALQGDSAAELDALLPAILDRAFKGEL